MKIAPQTLVKPIMARGKALLIQAALKLAVRTRSIAALGVREIGREAGLNPNSFYKHFSSIEDLGIAILEEVANNLRKPLRDIRRMAAETITQQFPMATTSIEHWENSLQKARLAARLNIDAYFKFVIQNKEAFMVGVSEMTGSSPKLRGKIQNLVGELTNDLLEDIRIYQLAPMLSDKSIFIISTIMIRYLFHSSVDYIDHPERRADIEGLSYDLLINLMAGSIALELKDAQTTVRLISVLRQEALLDQQNAPTSNP